MGRTTLALGDGSSTTSTTLNTPWYARETESMKQSTLAMTVVEARVARSSRRRALASAGSIALGLLGASACGFPRPADVGGDATADVPGGGEVPDGMDGPAGPIVAIHVFPSGDDANDGLTLPVKTLKHAIELAAAAPKVTQIVLAAGTYSASSGETLPYIIPPNITVVGPAGGGAIIAGDKTVPGVTVDSGGLQDLSLQDFATAVTVTGAANLKNVRVLSSTIAVQAETTASLIVNNLNITGVAGTGMGSCSTGITLNGAAKLVAMTLTTHDLGATLVARDQSVVAIASATISGNPTCLVSSLMSVGSTASFSLSDSILDGGSFGITIGAQSTSFHATISNTIIRNLNGDGVAGFPAVKGSFQMTGGEISSNGQAGAELGLGTWIFTNVAIKNNKGLALYLQDANVIMRNSIVTGNGFGIDVFQSSVADLGTTMSPGNNVFQNNSNASVFAESTVPVSAIGNTWSPNVQGADSNGKYTTIATISGPVAPVANGNFQINEICSLSR